MIFLKPPKADNSSNAFNHGVLPIWKICVVLNRWGKMVYESSPYANDWRGQDQAGADLPDGTYYILLKGEEEFIYKGSVTLIRAR